MLACGWLVLADGHNGAACRVQVFDHLKHLLVCFAKAHHQPAFGGHAAVVDSAQQLEALCVVGLRAHLGVERGVGFHIVVDDVGLGVHDRAQGIAVALKIGDKHLNGALGQGLT